MRTTFSDNYQTCSHSSILKNLPKLLALSRSLLMTRMITLMIPPNLPQSRTVLTNLPSLKPAMLAIIAKVEMRLIFPKLTSMKIKLMSITLPLQTQRPWQKLL